MSGAPDTSADAWVAALFERYPTLSNALDADPGGDHLRVTLRCPRGKGKGHLIETVVLQTAPRREHLYVVSAFIHDKGYVLSVDEGDALARNSFNALQGRPEDATMFTDRVLLKGRRQSCTYSGVKTQAELVSIVVHARLVLDTPDFQLSD